MSGLALTHMEIEEPLPEQIKMKRFEPAFSSLNIDDNDLVNLSRTARIKMLSYYDRVIARQPSDLEMHFRRITLYVKQEDTSGAYSAVLDLFFAVNMHQPVQMGSALAIAKEALKEQDYLALKEVITTGDPSELALPEKSVLAKGFKTGFPLVKQNQGIAE